MQDNRKIDPSILLKEDLGGLAIFRCDPQVHKWFFEFGQLPDNAEVSTEREKITIKPIRLNNSGRYSCFSFNEQYNRYFVATVEFMPRGELFSF